MNSLVPSESANDQKNRLQFDSIGKVSTGGDLASEKDMNHEILGNLHIALGIPKEDLEAMINGEHFNHQY